MRPYRHIDSDTLEKWLTKQLNEIQWNAQHNFQMLSWGAKREVRKINRELDRRGRWVRESD